MPGFDSRIGDGQEPRGRKDGDALLAAHRGCDAVDRVIASAVAVARRLELRRGRSRLHVDLARGHDGGARPEGDEHGQREDDRPHHAREEGARVYASKGLGGEPHRLHEIYPRCRRGAIRSGIGSCGRYTNTIARGVMTALKWRGAGFIL